MDFTLARFANCVQAGGLALALIAMELVAGCASTDGDGRTTYLTRRPESVGVKSSCCLTLSQIREVGSLRSYQEITLAPTTEHYKFNQSLSPTLVFSLPADFQGRTLELLAEDSMRSMVLARVGVFPAPVAIFIDDADRLMAAPTDSGEYSRNNSLDLAYPQRIGRAYTIPIGARKVAITVDASLAGQKTKAADFNSENGEPTSNREPKDFLNAVYGNIEVLVHSDVQVARGSQSLAAKDTTLRLYVESGQAEPAQTSYALAALSDSKRLLAVGSHSEVVVWNLSAKREILRFPINQYTHTIAFSHDERLLVVGGNESQVWNLALRKRVSPLQTVYLAAISSDSHQILTSYADGASNESAWLWEYGEDQTVPTRRRGKAFPTICGLYFDDNEPRVIHFSESRPWDRKKTYRVVISDIEGHTIADLDNWPGSGIFTSCIYHSKAGILVAKDSYSTKAVAWDVKSRTRLWQHAETDVSKGKMSFSEDGRLLYQVDGNASQAHTIRVYDSRTGEEIVSSTPVRSRDGVVIVNIREGIIVMQDLQHRQVRGVDAATGVEVFQAGKGLPRLIASAMHPEGRHIALAFEGGGIEIFDFDKATFTDVIDIDVKSLSFSTDGKRLLARDSNRAVAFDFPSLGRPEPSPTQISSSYFSSSEPALLVLPGSGDEIRNPETVGTHENLFQVQQTKPRSGQIIKEYFGHLEHSRVAAVDRDRTMLMTGSLGDEVRIWSLQDAQLLHVLKPQAAMALAFRDDGLVLIHEPPQTFVLWSTQDERPLGRLIPQHGQKWIFVASDGRFDTNEPLEDISGAHWRAPDDPSLILPIDLFMRDYYEPKLIAKILDCAARKACADSKPSLDQLTSLNRVRPTVNRIDVTSSSNGFADVTVGVSSGRDPSQRNGKKETQPFDLRLFRNGQLVGQWPAQPLIDPAQGIKSWRQVSLVPMDKGEADAEHVFRVALPSRDRGKPVVFTAYAFNEDRIKSDTARSDKFKVPQDLPVRPQRAYVITIGVDDYDALQRKLHFAVRDAQAMSEALSHLEGYEMVRVSLTSQGRDVKAWQATKANIHAVLARLAGQPVRAAALAAVKGAERLSRATPDDLVIVTFSGHGHTTPEGRFYLLTSDSGNDNEISPAALARFISSDELSEWLRPIDAGQMALIIDACHSAASVDQPGFKPGPMGDRGLGQLAYDKAMRILAASQADEVALESAKLKQGLLTYALVHDGLAIGPDGKRAADIDRNGQLTLGEWLRWGEQHTSTLYADIQASRRDALYADRDGAIDPRLKTRAITRVQTPALFDFARKEARSSDVVLH